MCSVTTVALLRMPRSAALSSDCVLQVALIQNMLQPAPSTPAPAAAQTEAAASDADAADRPVEDDASQDAVQVATVDSFQVTCQTGNQLVPCCQHSQYKSQSAISEGPCKQDALLKCLPI